MGLSRNLGQYTDVQKVFDHFLNSEEDVHLTFPTRAAATRWRSRAYQYRKLLHEQQQKAAQFPGASTSTPYDDMIIRHDRENNPLVVVMTRVSLEATITDAEGNPINFEEPPADKPKSTPRSPTSTEEDDLEAAAAEFAKSLRGEQ